MLATISCEETCTGDGGPPTGATDGTSVPKKDGTNTVPHSDDLAPVARVDPGSGDFTP